MVSVRRRQFIQHAARKALPHRRNTKSTHDQKPQNTSPGKRRPTKCTHLSTSAKTSKPNRKSVYQIALHVNKRRLLCIPCLSQVLNKNRVVPPNPPQNSFHKKIPIFPRNTPKTCPLGTLL